MHGLVLPVNMNNRILGIQNAVPKITNSKRTNFMKKLGSFTPIKGRPELASKTTVLLTTNPTDRKQNKPLTEEVKVVVF